jgi:hypothetical protein
MAPKVSHDHCTNGQNDALKRRNRGLQHATDNQHIEWMPLDLASLASVRAFAREFAERDLPPWAMGTIIRCPGCGEALIRIAHGP